MPSHRYEPLPLEDEVFPSAPPYFTTAPPSFHTIDLSASPSQSQILPHRNDETAATFIPHPQRPSPPAPGPQPLSNGIEDGLSIWAPPDPASNSPSESDKEEDVDLVAQDEILVRLMERMEAIEQHFARVPMIGKQEIDLEASRQSAEKKKWTWSEFWTAVAVTLFLFWFGAVLGAAIVLPELRRRQGSGSG